MKRPIYLIFYSVLFTLFLLLLSLFGNKIFIQYQLMQYGVQTQGIVIEKQENQYAIVSFPDEQGILHQLRISPNSLNDIKDKQIPVWYLPQQPQRAIAATPPKISWKAVLPGMFFSIVFIVLTGVFLLSNIRFYWHKQMAKKYWQPVCTQIKATREVKYKVTSYWTIQLVCAEQNSEQEFISHYLWTAYCGSERVNILNDKINVYIHPNNPQKYFIDTTEIETKISEHDKILSKLKCQKK